MKHLLSHSYLLWHLLTSEIGIRNIKGRKKKNNSSPARTNGLLIFLSRWLAIFTDQSVAYKQNGPARSFLLLNVDNSLWANRGEAHEII
jgi:hypothetical protein